MIRIIVTLNPAAGPAGPATTWGEKFASLMAVFPVLLVFVVVIVGIYGGWANPTEAASIGALTSEKHKHFRQRRLTASNRTLQSSLQRLLNRTVDDNQPMLH